MRASKKAKANGVYKGRRVGIDAKRVRELAVRGMSVGAIASELGYHRQSIYRLTRDVDSGDEHSQYPAISC